MVDLHNVINTYRESIIQSEAEVRTKLIVPLLQALGYPDKYRAEEFPVHGYGGSKKLNTKEADFILFSDENFKSHCIDTTDNNRWVEAHSLLVVEAKTPGKMSEEQGQARFYTMWTKAIAYIETDGEQFKAFYYNPISTDCELINISVNDIPENNNISYLSFANLSRIKGEHSSDIQNKIQSTIDAHQFWEVQLSSQFKKFSKRVLEKYYGTTFFTSINGRSYPVYEIGAKQLKNKAENIKAYDCFCDYDNSNLQDFEIQAHQSYVNLPLYNAYSAIIGDKIRYPNRPGYMLDELSLDQNGKIDKIRVHVGTYAENVYSTHVLEYEMYLAYLEYGQNDLEDPNIWNQVGDFMKIRNHIHENVDRNDAVHFEQQMKHSLLCGQGHESLLSVQMLVIINNKRNHKYEVKYIQRSEQVAARPMVYQLVPAGGFEILNDSDDNIYDDDELEENFSPGCAIFREFIEELYNVPEFEGSGNGSIEDRLLNDSHIEDIESMLSDGRAEFLFLGSVLGLEGLRHELSFALIIHDENYSKNSLFANEEGRKGRIASKPVSEFCNNNKIWQTLHEPSAAMWDLFMKTSHYNKLVAFDAMRNTSFDGTEITNNFS